MSNACSIVGQADIYGLGIRIGLYIQWFSTILTYIYMPTQVTSFMVMNYTFSIAVAIATLVHRSELYQHELFLILILQFMPTGLFFCIVFDLAIWIVHTAWENQDPQKAENGSQLHTEENTLITNTNLQPPTTTPAPGQPAAQNPPGTPQNFYGGTNMVSDMVRCVVGMFLGVVTVVQMYVGLRLAKPVEGCEAKILMGHMNSRGIRVMKGFSITTTVGGFFLAVLFAMMRRALARSQSRGIDTEQQTPHRIPEMRGLQEEPVRQEPVQQYQDKGELPTGEPKLPPLSPAWKYIQPTTDYLSETRAYKTFSSARAATYNTFSRTSTYIQNELPTIISNTYPYKVLASAAAPIGTSATAIVKVAKTQGSQFVDDRTITFFRMRRFILPGVTVRAMCAVIWGLGVTVVVVAIEGMIYQNEIVGVRGVVNTGQLIPMIVGLLGFIHLIFGKFEVEARAEGHERAKGTKWWEIRRRLRPYFLTWREFKGQKQGVGGGKHYLKDVWLALCGLSFRRIADYFSQVRAWGGSPARVIGN